MKQIHYFIGLDVHKVSTECAVRDWNGNLVFEGSCATNFKDLYELLEPYLHSCKICLEASTSYYKLYKAFCKEKLDVRVANVVQLRTLIGKSDKLDAKRLADMLRLNAVPESFIPDDTIQRLRDMVVLYHRFVREETRLKNQIHAALDKVGIMIPVKTPFCKKWCALLHGYVVESSSIQLHHLYESWDYTSRKVEVLASEIKGYTKKHFPIEQTLLTSIPGFGELFASYIISQVLPISRFASKKKLRRYAGVIPVSNSSGGKEYGTYLPKMSSRKLLRYALVEGAHSTVKTKSRLTEYFKKKKKGHVTTHALLCVASSLSDIVYTVLTTGKPYEM